MQLVSVVPTDPSVLSKLGELYDSEQDKSQAFQYHFEVRTNLLTNLLLKGCKCVKKNNC